MLVLRNELMERTAEVHLIHSYESPDSLSTPPSPSSTHLYRHIQMGVEDVDLTLKIIGFLILRSPDISDHSVTYIEAPQSLAESNGSHENASVPTCANHSYTTCIIERLTIRHLSLERFFLDPPAMHAHTNIRAFFTHCRRYLMYEPGPRDWKLFHNKFSKR
ncbi:hypothetical protein CVT25_004552 [Psilocybe cyanescens]|uniref:Uncharacterized protein n=1 Tax=Psilocybe cyanescens TaxID=93625 RepID=A0A409XMN4_PSICY|nr:hypothetical protein CVT25_004552 [Psilocybe cyanescens]